MTYEDIEADVGVLLAQADELRAMPEDEPMRLPLAGLIDKINALRALQDVNAISTALPDVDPPVDTPRPGRPRKAVV